MKCLSLKQPYAELLVSGKKTIELRTWNTRFRGEFLMHASKKVDRDACLRMKIDPDSLVTGAVVGKATLYDVKFYNNRNLFIQDRNKHLAGTKYSYHKYGFLVKNSRKFKKPLFMPGKLGFFNVEYNE
jgi:ASCH domain